ncbi:mannose-1-phosphate guanylyltransferase/mannose-6-phosphate isomerase [Falsiroseomonas tokyonensis]|uniref:Mannose-1-phosphate guanylyltransferase/mannose-6-phosphate isomerase n=1 Tax=Falsiroseomonas tokyonensis TaxID=430521 RepID=A0ABV7C0X8_9PROT|nr:mannose-1-phosphate guanylyltransferase/mannose-6-phosphate isomerase [Falsiroseomonas tokyonensis]MBU8541448.1 mannose-1-phosphate guanylyltransferase/mannose-6-phosphate isomerase [Falsiroseomonas tokyonensis]
MDLNVLHPGLSVDATASELAGAPGVAPLARTAAPSRIVPVILSGGSGSRLWPLSRESLPKQFLALTSQRTMLQETVLRAQGCGPEGPDFAAPIIVCNQEHRFLAAAQLSELGIADRRILLEPIGRSSAPAICAAALLVAEEDPDALIWMKAADALVEDTPALHRLLRTGAEAARDGRIVTFGIRPTSAEAGYGYIEVGPPLDAAAGAHAITRFVEKPKADVAAGFVASGRYLWNSGMYLFTARGLLREMALHAPELLAHATEAIRLRRQDPDFIRLDEVSFTACPSLSLDHAVAEHTALGAVVPAELRWSDVGSWDALWQVGRKDAAGNAASGDALLVGSRDCYVRSEDGVVTAVVGLEDVVVVATGDAVLAVHRDQAQDVRRVVKRLKEMGRKQASQHSRCHRPWGYYETLSIEGRFQVKHIVVQPGQKLSLQKHFHRAEHWVVVQGSALVTRDAEEILLTENQAIHLPLGCVHRLSNPGRIPLAIIEVQLGAYLGEDDIVRLEDMFGRC